MGAISQSVSVIVPVKNSERTIRSLVESLLAQEYGGVVDILLIGNEEDSTWSPVADIIAQGRIRAMEIALPEDHEGRDANLKRKFGCENAIGEILALTDSDMVLPPDWIATNIRLLAEYGVTSVAGVMRAGHHSRNFFQLHADHSIIAKTPRFPKDFLLDKNNFGKSRILPITANWFIERAAYERTQGFNPEFNVCYEDYSFAWEFVKVGSGILCTNRSWGYHFHRQNPLGIVKEYLRSGSGFFKFSTLYPECPFTRKRKVEVGAFMSIFILCISCLVMSPVKGLFLLFSVTILLGVLNFAKARLFQALLFPVISIVLSLFFSFSYLLSVLCKGKLKKSYKFIMEN
jgi:glycosyltransferase involved in cell wall biosynthesis